MANNNKKILPNVPTLRFPEFTEEWKATMIGEVCSEFKSGKGIKADNISEIGNYPVYGGNGLRGFTSEYNHNGLYVLIGRQGALCGNINVAIGKMYITEHAVAVSANADNNTRFLQYLFLKMNLGQYSDQSAQPGLAVNKLIRLKANVPSLSEQDKIASLFSLLDERIATQNKIIEDLKKLKSAIYQFVFESEDAESTLLANLAKIVKGKQINGEYLSDLGEYYVMNGGVELSGYYSECNTDANTISISEGGNSCGYVQYNKVPFWSGGHCYTLQNLSQEINEKFLFHYLKFQESKIMKLRIGSGLPNIQKKDLAKFIIILPSIERQKTLATIFDTIDNKESNETTLRKTYEIQKSSLLQQMFI